VPDADPIRASFPYLAQCVYLNTASVGLSWAGEGAAAAEFYDAKAQGAGAMGAWAARTEATREELGALLHVPPATVDFVSSTTGSRSWWPRTSSHRWSCRGPTWRAAASSWCACR